jgi:hypothetical protein
MKRMGIDPLRCNCGTDLRSEEWFSRFGDSHEQHYKSADCPDCGKKNWRQAGFFGSGHDTFTQPETQLESTVRKVGTK